MTTPEQRGYNPANEDRPEPTLVQYDGQEFEAQVAADDAAGVTPSANRRYWARAIDDQYTESNRASNADQQAAFAEYQRRPDIESRSSILAREHAQPAEFENVVVPNSNFDDAVANTEDNSRPGYIGQFDFEDHHGVHAASSNGGGAIVEVVPGNYTPAPYDNPGSADATAGGDVDEVDDTTPTPPAGA